VRLLFRDACVRYLVDVLADTLAVTVVCRASIVPSVGRRRPLRKAFAAVVTEQLPLGTRVSVEVEFELRGERPLAVPAGVSHTRHNSNRTLYLHRNVHAPRFEAGSAHQSTDGGGTAGAATADPATVRLDGGKSGVRYGTVWTAFRPDQRSAQSTPAISNRAPSDDSVRPPFDPSVTRSVQSWASAMSWTITSPRPVPSSAVV